MALLDVKNLYVEFTTYGGIVHAVRGVDFSVDEGETLAIVGESGCGKSVTVQSIMGLIPDAAWSYHARYRASARSRHHSKQDHRREGHPRQLCRHDLSRSDDVSKSDHDDRRADRGAFRSASRLLASTGNESSSRTARHGSNTRSGQNARDSIRSNSQVGCCSDR